MNFSHFLKLRTEQNFYWKFGNLTKKPSHSINAFLWIIQCDTNKALISEWHMDVLQKLS